MNTNTQLDSLLEGCRKYDPRSQEQLYRDFRGFAISICMRYVHHTAEAHELVNDGFMKVFDNINRYNQTQPFKHWLSRIMTNVSIDHYRVNRKYYQNQELSHADSICIEEDLLAGMSYENLLKIVEKLSPSYKKVFKMYVFEGYSHEEIATKLSISVGSSKSNLARAREFLRSKF